MRHLFDQTRVRGLSLRNRFVRSATWEGLATERGYLTDRLQRVYEELAEGELGLIITGFTLVMDGEQPRPRMMRIHDDSYVEDFRRLTRAVHARSGRIVLQIGYGGTQAGCPVEGGEIWAPSAVPEMSSGMVGREMARDDIERLVRAFGDAAARAEAAGFDGVQIHAAHGFLLSQFLNPHHNRRTDEYGGPIENRARLLFDVHREIRNRVGVDFGVWVKVNAEDFVEGGASLNDCRHVCAGLERLGADAIEISGGMNAAGKNLTYARPNIVSPEQEAYFAQQAASIAEEVQTPIVLVGGLRSLEVMERLLAVTKISYFALSRPLLAEPDLVKRWKGGDTDRARCISCNRCRAEEGNICIFHRQPGLLRRSGPPI